MDGLKQSNTMFLGATWRQSPLRRIVTKYLCAYLLSFVAPYRHAYPFHTITQHAFKKSGGALCLHPVSVGKRSFPNVCKHLQSYPGTDRRIYDASVQVYLQPFAFNCHIARMRWPFSIPRHKIYRLEQPEKRKTRSALS